MKKFIITMICNLTLLTALKAENIEFEGCDDIINDITSKKSEYTKSMIINNLKVKKEFLEALEFKVNNVVDYKHVCKILFKIEKEKKYLYELAKEKKNLYQIEQGLSDINNIKEQASYYLNNIIDKSLLTDNNISFDEYSLRLNSKIQRITK